MPKERVTIRKAQKQDEITVSDEPISMPLYNAKNEVVNATNKYGARDVRSLLKGSDSVYTNVAGRSVLMAVRMPNGEFSEKTLVTVFSLEQNAYLTVLMDDGIFYNVDLQKAKFWEVSEE